ncbi:Asp23/Gls24 family envelope stress response protein [Kallotenue papyrolyticum]|uniref:Asp23/Gls24 family envelope stress response protein n=1 Tax=Kallotenue papyrolyticum TaxID=1325125 RepID=UPI0004785596
MAPGALISIISRTVQDVPGVVRMGTVPPSRVGQLLTGSHTRDGVLVRVMDGTLSADVYLIAESDTNLLELGERVQAAVAYAIRELVGMQVRDVNVYIQDVEAARA